MNKITRAYNQNRALIIAIIGIIALIIIIIQVLNSIAREERQAKLNNSTNDGNSSTNSQGTTILQENTSVITGEEVVNSKSNQDLIKEFVKYCNEGKIENAYNMLSNECKTRIYPSLERFKNLYYNKIFYIKRLYSLENWFTSSRRNTYAIKYTEDILATGNTISKDNYSDYITVERKENQNYININSYVGSYDVNKSKTVNGVTVTVEKMYMYIDYTILTVNVKNDTQSTICVDTKEKVDTMYLYDENEVRYTAMLNENSAEELQVKKRMQSKFNVKFNKMYNPESREIYGIKLDDIVLNYEAYLSRK